MSNWFRLAKIATFGRLSLAILVIATVLTAALLVSVADKVGKLDEDWQRYEQNVANKVVLLSQIRAALGVGELTDHLHKYSATGNAHELVEAHRNLLQLKVLLRGYRSSNTSGAENLALERIQQRLDVIRTWMVDSESKMQTGPVWQLQIFPVHNQPIQDALTFLDRALSEQRQSRVSFLSATVHNLSTQTLYSALAISLLLIIITVGFAWFFRANLRIPIENLAAAFGRINPSSDGDQTLPVRNPVQPNELDQVAMAGNKFLDELQIHMKERQQTSDALRESEQHVRAILDNTGEGIITIDSRGLINSYNKGAQKIFGYSADEVIGRNVSMLSPPSERHAHDGYVANSNMHESRIINNTRNLNGCRKDGSVFPLELHVTRMGSGEDKAFIGIMRDITERMVAQRKLEAAVVSAETANLAKSEFLSSMSHELRTPMNTVLGFAQLLETDEETPLNEDQQNSVGHIVRSGKHLLSLINDVLDMSKIESGKIEVSWEWTDVYPLVSLCINEMEPTAETRNITIRNEVPDPAGQVWVDYTKLKQVLLNILSNAVKYNHDGGEVVVSLLPTPDNHVCIGIRDTGPGLNEEQQQKIFVPFDRLGAEMSEVQGTGIGLSITRKLVELMDGKIGVESTPGKGSIFKIEFTGNLTRTQEVAALNDPEATSSILNGNGLPTEDHPFDFEHKILYVEDNPANLELMRNILDRRTNCTSLLAETGTRGYDLAREELPDAIILDINLPDLDGLQILRRLRSTEKTRNIPVIGLTAAAMSEELRRAEREDFDKLLTKPVNVKNLNRQLDQLLTKTANDDAESS